LKELGHLLLRQPNGVVLNGDFNLRFIVLGFVKGYLFHLRSFIQAV
jgi:hypothetical protein